MGLIKGLSDLSTCRAYFGATIKPIDLSKYQGQSGSGSSLESKESQSSTSTTGTAHPSDGHTYDLQKSPNESGLHWDTITTDNNASDAQTTFNTYSKMGGYYQTLKDGQLWLTNLPESSRYEATEAAKAAAYAKDIWSTEVLVTGGMQKGQWAWTKDFNSLDAAKAALTNGGATLPATAADAEYRITDKNN